MVAVGRIVRPHGIRGQVVIEPETDFGEDRFAAGSTLYARRGDEVEALTVENGRAHDGRWVVGFAGVGSMEDAEAWRGQELRIPADAVHALGPNAFYVHDLVGCEVVTTTGEFVGVVTQVDLPGGPPMLVVGREAILVPFIDAICRQVDITQKRIEIDPPAGLMDVNVKTRRSTE